MGIMDKLPFGKKRKEQKQNEAMHELELKYQQVSRQITELEKKQEQAKEKATGQAPGSPKFMEAQREWNQCKKLLGIYRSTQAQLQGKLAKIDDVRNIRDFTNSMNEINKISSTVLDSDTENEELLDEAMVMLSKAQDDAKYDGNFAHELYDNLSSNASGNEINDEFATLVAKNEERQVAAGLSGKETPLPEGVDAEFTSLFNSTNNT